MLGIYSPFKKILFILPLWLQGILNVSNTSNLFPEPAQSSGGWVLSCWSQPQFLILSHAIWRCWEWAEIGDLRTPAGRENSWNTQTIVEGEMANPSCSLKCCSVENHEGVRGKRAGTLLLWEYSFAESRRVIVIKMARQSKKTKKINKNYKI